MKKLFITIAFVAATFFAQAQLFVGGSLGLDFGSTKVESTKTQKTFGFDFNPTVGYMFNDNMGVGMDILFGIDKTTFPKVDPDDVESSLNTTTFGIAPYFRYVFAEIDNFKFYADAKINFSTSKDKTKADSKTFDGDKTTDFGFGIIPGIQYNFTDHISMVASLNLLRLGFNSTTIKSKVEVPDPDDPFETKEKEVKTVNNSFGFGVNEAPPLTVGFVYTF